MYQITIRGIAPLIYTITAEVIEEAGLWYIKITEGGGYPPPMTTSDLHPFPDKQAAEAALDEMELHAAEACRRSLYRAASAAGGTIDDMMKMEKVNH